MAIPIFFFRCVCIHSRHFQIDVPKEFWIFFLYNIIKSFNSISTNINDSSARIENISQNKEIIFSKRFVPILAWQKRSING